MSVLYCFVWGILWGLVWFMGHTGAVPMGYSGEQLYNVRDYLPATPLLPSDVLKQLRIHGLHTIPKTARGTSAGRSMQRSIQSINPSYSRVKSGSSQKGANHNNLTSVKLTANHDDQMTPEMIE